MSLEGRQDIATQELNGLISAHAKARADRMEKQAVWDHVKNLSVKDERLFAMPGISQNNVIEEIRKELIRARNELREEKARVSAEYPRNRQLEARIAQLEQELAEEVDRMGGTTKAELDRAVAYEKSIEKDLQQHKAAMENFSETAGGNDVLQRQEKINQDIYEILLKQSREIDLTGRMESSNMRVVDPAEVPRYPIKPRVFLIILLAIVLGLFLGTGLAFFVEYMDNTLKTPGDVVRRLGMLVMGALPYERDLKRGKNPLLSWDDSAAKKGKTPAVCAQVDTSSCVPALLHAPGEGAAGKVMMIESATAGEGKTTVAAQFAHSLTHTGLRVLMVDCDFQRPSLHKLFGLQNQAGLAGALNAVLSDKISNGSLARFSIADIFFLIGLAKKSGRLIVRDESKTATMTAFFQDGRFLHLQNHNNPPANLLGNMLLTGGFITENQLKDAIERNQRTGQPLGYILMNAGYISRDKLRGPLRLQTEENLQKLFSWKKGSFAFGNGQSNAYDKERILFGDDYTAAIAHLGRLEGYNLLETEILANITNGQAENLYVLPAGATSAKPIGQVNVALLAKFIEILKQRFDIILLDSPPLDAGAGNATLFQLTDGVVFVIKAGHLSVRILDEAKAAIPEDKLVGAVLNQVRRKDTYYYYR